MKIKDSLLLFLLSALFHYGCDNTRPYQQPYVVINEVEPQHIVINKRAEPPLTRVDILPPTPEVVQIKCVNGVAIPGHHRWILGYGYQWVSPHCDLRHSGLTFHPGYRDTNGFWHDDWWESPNKPVEVKQKTYQPASIDTVIINNKPTPPITTSYALPKSPPVTPIIAPASIGRAPAPVAAKTTPVLTSTGKVTTPASTGKIIAPASTGRAPVKNTTNTNPVVTSPKPIVTTPQTSQYKIVPATSGRKVK